MNTKHPLYKEKLKVEEEIHQLWKIQCNKNWIELEKPYKNGYYKVWDLREDIKNRDDAWVYYECIKLVGEKIWGRDKTFKKKIKKGTYQYVSPGFGYITERAFENLIPAVKKHFSEVGPYSKYYNYYEKRYTCTVHTYYFVEKVKAHWVTHYQEFDSVLDSQINEREDYIRSQKFWPILGWYTGAPKDFVKGYNRSDRRHSRQTVQRNIVSGGDDCSEYEYRYQHRHGARWDWY